MIATISWWNLERSAQTIESLRSYLHGEGVAPWEAIAGMRMKFWMSDPANNLWGAVVLWEHHEAMSQSLPPNRATELIGYPPTWRSSFDVEALIDQVQVELAVGVLVAVDVDGEALSVVVIDKLPFAAPDDPVLQARPRASGSSCHWKW